jgi:hypothetical protein
VPDVAHGRLSQALRSLSPSIATCPRQSLYVRSGKAKALFESPQFETAACAGLTEGSRQAALNWQSGATDVAGLATVPG